MEDVVIIVAAFTVASSFKLLLNQMASGLIRMFSNMSTFDANRLDGSLARFAIAAFAS